MTIRFREREQLTTPASESSTNTTPVSYDRWLLETEAGALLMAEVAAVTNILPAHHARWRKRASPEQVAAAIDLVRARAKAGVKFTKGAEMWLTTVGLEQATSEAVARHKAARFPDTPIVDLCAGIGGDAIALAGRGAVVAVDLDPAMCERIGANAELYGVGDRILPVRGRAESFVVPRESWVHLDPDRRYSRAKRARRLEDYTPDPSFWTVLMANQPGGAIKLGPASDFPTLFEGRPVEIELVSLKGECKEATAWFGAAVTCGRRATRLPENLTWTDRDGGSFDYAEAAPLAAYIFDPDPALLRAGLLDGFACAHHLNRVADGVEYLTSDDPHPTPWLSAYGVLDASPLDIRHVRKMLARHDIGSLEIKVRGAEITPETLRPQLKLEGEKAATLLIVGGPNPTRVILATKLLRA